MNQGCLWISCKEGGVEQESTTHLLLEAGGEVGRSSKPLREPWAPLHLLQAVMGPGVQVLRASYVSPNPTIRLL